jgi:hypothetical protein
VPSWTRPLAPRRRPGQGPEAELFRILDTRDLLDQAVYCLAVGHEQLRERIARSSVALAAVRREDLETEAEHALYARVQLGLSQLRNTDIDEPDDALIEEDVPVFALEATASHIVDLRDATTQRLLRAARDRRPRRRT